MGYYSGKFIICNETDGYDDKLYLDPGHVLTIKLSAKFNDVKLFLNSKLVDQLLKSKAVRKFILDDTTKYINKHEEQFKKRIGKICFTEMVPDVKVSIIGRYFYIKIYCGRNHTKDDCIKAVRRRLLNERTKEEILRGEEL